jgi:small subunit ribosomal protein S2
MSAHTDSKKSQKTAVDAMFDAGAHYGFIKSRRHPTVKKFIFGVKNKVEIFDLEKTETQLTDAVAFIKKIAAAGKQVVFIGSKSEARVAIKEAAERIAQPFVASRWIGGTFTNFDVIRKRVEKLLELSSQKEKGELNKYTKKERLMIDREIERLTGLFGGITTMNHLPGAIFVADPKKEHIAVAEAIEKRIPVIALAGSDCDISTLTYPIVANDASAASVAFFADKIAAAYAEGKTLVGKAPENQ